MLEETEADLHGEDAANGFIDLLDGDLSAGYGCGEILPVRSGPEGHFHIDTGLETEHGGLREIFRIAMRREILDSVGVAHDESLEAPVFAQYVMQQPAIDRSGHVVEVHVCGHGGADARFYGGVKGRKVDVPHLVFGDIGGVVVASAFGCAISGEVLHAGENVFGRADIWALKAVDLR